MTMHEDLHTALQQKIESLEGVTLLSPTSVALAVQRHFAGDQLLEPHVQYASLEHLKLMARQVLAKRFGSFGAPPEDDQPYLDETFSNLQKWYPTPRKGGQERGYKKLEDLSDDEVLWNINMLKRSAGARIDHAEALKNWMESRRRMGNDAANS